MDIAHAFVSRPRLGRSFSFGRLEAEDATGSTSIRALTRTGPQAIPKARVKSALATFPLPVLSDEGSENPLTRLPVGLVRWNICPLAPLILLALVAWWWGAQARPLRAAASVTRALPAARLLLTTAHTSAPFQSEG